MATIQERRKEFLDETVKFYSEDVTRRAIQDSSKKDDSGCFLERCVYRMVTPDGTVKKCAIGRHIPDYQYDKEIEGKALNSIVLSYLPDEIRELGENFLCYVQSLHDTEKNWDANGLTPYGKEYYDKIVRYNC